MELIFAETIFRIFRNFQSQQIFLKTQLFDQKIQFLYSVKDFDRFVIGFCPEMTDLSSKTRNYEGKSRFFLSDLRTLVPAKISSLKVYT